MQKDKTFSSLADLTHRKERGFNKENGDSVVAFASVSARAARCF